MRILRCGYVNLRPQSVFEDKRSNGCLSSLHDKYVVEPAVVVAQVKRYSTRKLLNQGFLVVKLKSPFRKFYGRHNDLV
jgi:hypothetical protein